MRSSSLTSTLLPAKTTTRYAKYFVDELPYNAAELREMANMSFDQLKAAAERLSIEDVISRR